MLEIRRPVLRPDVLVVVGALGVEPLELFGVGREDEGAVDSHGGQFAVEEVGQAEPPPHTPLAHYLEVAFALDDAGPVPRQIRQLLPPEPRPQECLEREGPRRNPVPPRLDEGQERK